MPPHKAPGSKYRFENNFRLHPKTPSKGSCAPVKCSNLLAAALLGYVQQNFVNSWLHKQAEHPSTGGFSCMSLRISAAGLALFVEGRRGAVWTVYLGPRGVRQVGGAFLKCVCSSPLPIWLPVRGRSEEGRGLRGGLDDDDPPLDQGRLKVLTVLVPSHSPPPSGPRSQATGEP